tara:strand:- start:25 stop:612 length:588 start_codon:yes stop_codon:yes gene_type:complete
LITKEKFDFIKEKYGKHASWAIWAEQGKLPKSNMGDMSVLDPNINTNLFAELNPEIILIGLNFAEDIDHESWEVFHKYRPQGTDFKTRFALKNTKWWGAYMTDILKDYPEKHSQKVNSHLKKHPELEEENIRRFYQEIKDVGSKDPLLVAFGNIVYEILKRNMDDFKITKIPHYAHYMSKEKYREEVKKVILEES